jgi:benzoylformate decarboxylase
MFGNPGTTELPLMDGLAREPKIRYILALQVWLTVIGYLKAGRHRFAPRSSAEC